MLTECGQTFQENSGSFESVSYSNSLSEQPEKCEWRISAIEDGHVRLNITFLDLSNSDECLMIYDGYWHKSPLLGTNPFFLTTV